MAQATEPNALTEPERALLRALVDAHGEPKVCTELAVHRHTLPRLLAALNVHGATVTAVRLALLRRLEGGR